MAAYTPTPATGIYRAARRRAKGEARHAAASPRPVPGSIRIRGFPLNLPPRIWTPEPFPQRVILADVAFDPSDLAICGAYLGDGPGLVGFGGRFLGPAAPAGIEPPGPGPLRTLDNWLDRVLWRLARESRFGFLAWDPAALFSSLAFTFRNGGAWAVLWTYPGLDGEPRVDYHRTPIVFEPRSNGRVGVRFGPRRHPDPRDFDPSGRQFPGHIVALKDAIAGLVGERVDDPGMACRLFEIAGWPSGPATPQNLLHRIEALRDLYRTVRREAESWPGVHLERLSSPTAIVSGAHQSARIPQPLLRDRRSLRVPARAIGAGIEAASVGARTGLFIRRVRVPGLDVDITASYPVGSALAGVQDFLTHQVTAHRLTGRQGLHRLRRQVERAVATGLLDHPELWGSLSFLCKVRPAGDVLTAHIELFGTEATVTGPVAEGSLEFWVTGVDLAVAILEDLDRGGAGRVPEIVEAWTFSFGPRLRRLRPVSFPGGWTWDPRRPSTYRSKDGRTWGNLYLLLAAMRAAAKADPALSPARRLRLRGMLKVASVAGAFGMFSATVPRDDASPGDRWKVIAADGIKTIDKGHPERPGPWAFPPAAALVEGSGRLLLTLLMHEVRRRCGVLTQADTDGGFIVSTPEGGPIEIEGTTVQALSFAQVQAIRDAFIPLAGWAGLPIATDRIEGTRLVPREGPPSLLKIEDTVKGPDGELDGMTCYAPGIRRFAIRRGDRWRISENSIGPMVNPTELSPQEFAHACYRYLEAREHREVPNEPWLDEPTLWPKALNRSEDLKVAKRAIPDLRTTETVLYARSLFGETTYIARAIPGRTWRELDWRTEEGRACDLIPAVDQAIGAVRTWRFFLDSFLRHPVAFTLDATGHPTDARTRGLLSPAPIRLVGKTLTGRTGWATDDPADVLIPDRNEWQRVLERLGDFTEAELRRAGLAPRTARAMRQGRPPLPRNAEAARRLVAERARTEAGLRRGPLRPCIAAGCQHVLTGRARLYCPRHAAYPGYRRKAWREAAGR